MTGARESRYTDAAYADRYHEDRFGGRFGAFLERFEVDLLRELLNGTDGRVLDAGAGSGKLTAALLADGRAVVAADASAQMLTTARTRVGRRGQFVVADLEALCFPDEAFGASVSSRVLMHVRDWAKAVSELCRVSRQAVVVDVPPVASVAVVDALWKGWRKRSHDPGYRTFRVTAVERQFERAGFVVVQRRRSFVLPYRFHRWLDRPGISAAVETVFRWTGLTRLVGAPVTVKAMRRARRPGIDEQ